MTNEFKVGDRVRWRKDDDGFKNARLYGADGVVTIATIDGAGDDPLANLTFEGLPQWHHWARRFEHVPPAVTIDPARTYRTRDGREVRIYATDGAEGTIHGAVKKERGWVSELWHAGGVYWLDGEESGFDLIEVKPERAGWVNIYPGYVAPDLSFSKQYETKELADSIAMKDRIACVYLKFREGDGLEGGK